MVFGNATQFRINTDKKLTYKMQLCKFKFDIWALAAIDEIDTSRYSCTLGTV